MRISRHQMFMEIAQVVAKRSTCFRESVGAIIVKENKVISIGYNGAAANEPHCTFHPNGKCDKSIHAEDNAIMFAGNHRQGSCDLYVTHLPCEKCIQLIISSHLFKRVFFQIIYGDTKNCYALLDAETIQLLRVLPSGDITSHDREELLNVET